MTQYSFKQLGDVGRLGNQLFQIAWTVTQAKLNEADPCVIPTWDYRHVFSLPEAVFVDAGPDSIDGGREFYQDISLWQGTDDEVRHMFQPSAEAWQRTLAYVSGEGIPASTLIDKGCAVHHRRGDYLKYPQHYPMPTRKYYENAMLTALARRSDTVFFIFSDDMPNVRAEYEHDPFTRTLIDQNQMVFFEGVPRPVEVVDRIGEPLDWLDLFTMMACRQHIIANSTFSWWSGFLSTDTQVMYPSVWYGRHKSVRSIPWRNMIPASWEQVTC